MDGQSDDRQAAMAEWYTLFARSMMPGSGRCGRASEPGYLSGLTDSPEAS